MRLIMRCNHLSSKKMEASKRGINTSTQAQSPFNGSFCASEDVTADIPERAATTAVALPDCGKSALLHTLSCIENPVPSAHTLEEAFLGGLFIRFVQQILRQRLRRVFFVQNSPISSSVPLVQPPQTVNFGLKNPHLIRSHYLLNKSKG